MDTVSIKQSQIDKIVKAVKDEKSKSSAPLWYWLGGFMFYMGLVNPSFETMDFMHDMTLTGWDFVAELIKHFVFYPAYLGEFIRDLIII